MNIVELLELATATIGGGALVLVVYLAIIKIKERKAVVFMPPTPPTGAWSPTRTRGTEAEKPAFEPLKDVDLRCPRCGKGGYITKTWQMAGRTDKSGKRTELQIGLVHCSQCNNTWRLVLKKKPKRIE